MNAIQLIYRSSVFKALIKLLVFVATAFYIWEKVLLNENIQDMATALGHFARKQIILISIVFLFMFVNWLTESYKWKLLIDKLESINILRAFKAVWAGASINNWIPNHTGEFIGRVYFVSSKNRGGAVSATLAGNAAQLLCMAILGSFSFILWIELPQTIETGLIVLAAGLSIAFTVAYYRIAFVHQLAIRFRFLKFAEKYLDVLSQYSKQDLTKILLLSVFRLSVYILQYSLLLRTFQFDLSLQQMIQGSLSVFFIQTILPSITLTDPAVRGAGIVYIFGGLTSNNIGLLYVALSLWFINVIIPSVIGTLFLLAKKNSLKR